MHIDDSLCWAVETQHCIAIIIKIIKKKTGSLRRWTKFINLQPESSRNKKEKAQISNIRNEKCYNGLHRNKKKIIGDHYRQVCANRMENLEETDNLLEKYSLPAEPEEVDNTNRPGTGTKTETDWTAPNTQKCRARRRHRHSVKHLGKSSCLCFWNSPEHCSATNTPSHSVRPPSPWC